MPIEIRPLVPEDWDRVRAICEEGIATGDATFETDAPSWEAWSENHLEGCRIVGVSGGRIGGVGGARPGLGAVQSAEAWRRSASTWTRTRGAAGVGQALLAALVEVSERAGIWTLQAGIFPENEGSVRIHERAGFRHVGRRERLGRLAGRWRDVLLLARRSPSVGIDAAST